MKKQKKGIFILYIITVVFYCVFLALSLTIIDIQRKNEARKYANTLMYQYDIIDKKTDFVNALIAEEKWVQKMSALDEDGFNNIFPLDIYEAQRNILNYNALIGFSCETLIMFDRSSFAMTERGKVPYSELEFYFDGAAQGFSIYSKTEDVYGDVRYVKSGSVISAIIYSCPNKLNAYKVRCLFILSKDYIQDFFNEVIDTDCFSIYYNGKKIISGKGYKESQAVFASKDDFVFGYYKRFPVAKFILTLFIGTAFFIIIFFFSDFQLKNYYNNMQRYIRQLNELAGKSYSEYDSSEGITKQFEKILLEISQIELQSKVALSKDFSRLVKEYINIIAHYGEINNDVLKGLMRLGVDIDQKIVIAYTGKPIKIQESKSTVNLGDAVLFLNSPVRDIQETYGQSNYYDGFAFIPQAYNESKIAYEVAALYEKNKVAYSSIGVFEPLPIIAREFEINLRKEIMALNKDNLTETANNLKKELLKNYINPKEIYDFFDRIENILHNLEKELYLEVVAIEESISISQIIDDILRRASRLIKGFSQKREDRYVYYFNVIKNYIDQHFTEPDFSLESVAERFNYSTPYVSRIFTKYGNISYSDYINQKRMELACQLLSETDLSINAVAQKCGITSPVTFRRVFKKYTGKLPSDFRK
ncbi:MAG TPA: AraC family transcriptional regulator [Clostridia bacterium]